MSNLDVDQMLGTLRTHGTLDSTGVFTISLAQARQKLTHYRSSNRARYLVRLFSAAVAGGATSATVERGDAHYRLSFPTAYIPEDQLLGSFSSGGHESDWPGAVDLIMGLQAVLAEGAEAVNISVWHPNLPSFHWSLGANDEASGSLQPDLARMEIVISFPQSWQERLTGIWKRWRGYVGQPEELRLLEQLCDHSNIPLTARNERLDRPFFLADSTLAAQVGTLGTQRLVHTSRPPVTQLEYDGWRGFLVLHSMPVTVVVHGVSMGQVAGLGVSGIVHHDQLKLDLSREQIVTDDAYNAFLHQLAEVRLALFEEMTHRLSQLEITPDRLIELLQSSLSQELSSEGSGRLLDWLDRRYPGSVEAGETRDAMPTVLVRLYQHSHDLPAGSLEGILIEECAHAFRTRSPKIPLHAHSILTLMEDALPSRTLLPGYVLLGLGAYRSWTGEEKLAQEIWMQALDMVRAGTDARAEELIHAHMDYPVEHMMEQVAIALSLSLSETSTSGDPRKA